MSNQSKLFDILLMVSIALAAFFTIIESPGIFLIINISFSILVLIFSVRQKNIDLFTIALIALLPIFLEFIVFEFGIISVSSTGNKLVQNSIIFGYYVFTELVILICLIKREAICQRFYPPVKIKQTLADDLLPWLFLAGIFVSSGALFENYLRNGKGYDITFFFHSFDIIGYFVKTMVSLILFWMAYQEVKSINLRESQIKNS